MPPSVARCTSDVSGYFDEEPRAPQPEDAQATRVLLMGALGVTPYIDRALEVLDLAERGGDPEHRALVIARDGTVGGARLHTAALAPGVEADDVGERLMRAAVDRLRAEGARYISADVPDDPAIGAIVSLLRDSGFEEEARVPDFYREGVALTFLRLSLG